MKTPTQVNEIKRSYTGCRWFLISSIILFAVILYFLCSCSVAYDIQYSIDNWQMEDIENPYYVDVKDVYKPGSQRIRKNDSIRYINR